ncbi:pyruvate/2-oxoglutarate dehydrogenase complex dihydrolipoamide dehydrogenase (E3) component [Microbacterium sp. W4I4]|uniref:FAD-dependent oxidoreductase n=1 Tax=Microbacterium sp. W4I4 TaxID=3042295 RepID=UPI0027800505|nr:FAD-dependent oxidoreductase [Microbacterium sp. W4I4]MDQ0615629.1 pyruvate/2-oxoglutarate dehydrogenase complex dihydrolipoamide dehydrogenase (E3) component [Microbacterium sp. W4I4]
MADIDVDVLVIGWGKGGKTLAGALGRNGRSVALVEQSNAMYGGSCINIACIPTKDLVHSASQRRPEDDPQAWFTAAVAGRDALTEKLRARNHAMLAEVDTVTLIDGRARFTGAHDVQVTAGDDTLTMHAETIIINTGTAPAEPRFPVDGSRAFDSTTIQHVDPLPERLVIVGGGYVGLEFAGMFSKFGSRVTIIDHGDTFMRNEDRDVADAARSLLEESGVQLILGGDVRSIRDESGTTTVELAVGGGARTLETDAVLVAVGRHPVTAELGLDTAGVAVDERGYVVVDDRLRTSVPHIFAVGDVNGGPQFTYISLDDNRIVMDQLNGSGARTTDDRTAVPYTVFLTPPLGRVGMNEAQARASGRRVLVASKAIIDIAAMPRPKIVGETHGLIKVLIDADTDLILGAVVFSIDAQEVINLIALAMRHDVTATELRDSIWTHPSSTEALNEVLAAPRPLEA